MISISLCMIVKNEEDVLARCLDSVAGVVDEMVIVDTGSTDSTMDIARGYTGNVYEFEWVDDFSKARNYSFSKATMDYQMWLDADDVLPAAEAEKLRLLKTELPECVDMVTMKYHTHFDSGGRPLLTSTRGRLFKRGKGYEWHDQVHEYVPMSGEIYSSDIAVSHMKQGSSGDRNLRIYEGQVAAGKQLSPRSTYYYARELNDHSRHGEAAEYFTAFLDGGQGWVEDNIAACLALGQCYGWLGDRDRQTAALLRSFSYDLPRPEICCELGYLYMNAGEYSKAVFWFRMALDVPKPQHMGFVQPDYSGFIPHVELCVCYCRLGDFASARLHNEAAGALKPDHPSIAHNRKYLAAK